MHKTLMCLLQAVDFLDNLLQYDHQERLTAREAMVEHLLASVCIHLPTQSLAVVVNFASSWLHCLTVQCFWILLSFYRPTHISTLYEQWRPMPAALLEGST
jgi:serine/threonine protein kinase